MLSSALNFISEASPRERGLHKLYSRALSESSRGARQINALHGSRIGLRDAVRYRIVIHITWSVSRVEAGPGQKHRRLAFKQCPRLESNPLRWTRVGVLSSPLRPPLVRLAVLLRS